MKEIKGEMSQIFHETAGVAISQLREISSRRKLKNLEKGTYAPIGTPPYIGQLAGADENKIERFYGHINDSNASKRFGTSDLEEYNYWAWRSCGITALQMAILNFHPDSDVKTMQLVKEGLNINGYKFKGDTGWYHHKIAELASHHNLTSEVRKFIPSTEIAYEIYNGSLALVSTKSATTGHFILAYGFEIGENSKLKGLYVQDPNEYKNEGENKFISTRQFNKISTRRCILVKPK